jgi:hypothetical protein
MRSNYSSVYKQYVGTNAYTSNSKFLQPNALIYSQQCSQNTIFREKIPSYFKYVPENLKINPDIQGNSFKEDYYPPRCDMCTKGGEQLPGAGYYGMQGSKKIGNEIKKYPGVCNYEVKEKFLNSKSEDTNKCKCDDDMTKELIFSRKMISFAPPTKWGSKAWDFFHSISFSYPNKPTKEQQQSAMNYFKALPFMLPCSSCGQHCQEQLKKFPPQVENKDKLTKWLYNFHNMVNKRLGKKTPSFEEVKKKYM